MHISGRCGYIFLTIISVLLVVLVLSRKMNPLSSDARNTYIEYDAVNYSKLGKNESCYGHSGFGYVFALDFSDQTTGGAINLMCLQCWAATVSHKIIVVEPFLHEGSKWGASLTPNNSKEGDDKENLVRLRDVLDIRLWDAEAFKRRFNKLTTWKCFLQLAPKDLILVAKLCPLGSCNAEESKKNFHDAALEFAEKNGFRLVREVIDENFHTYTAKQYRDLVYGNLDPSSSVVIMTHWGGFERKVPPYRWRSGISGINSCDRGNFFLYHMFQNSDLIKQDAQRYREKYLPNYKKGYISVMLRSEHFAIRHNLKGVTPDKQMSLLMNCVNSITENVNKLREKHGVEAVVLTMDCRKQGSSKFRGAELKSGSPLNKNIAKASEVLYQNLYGNSSTLEEWDDSFDSIGSYRNAGYLAQLQRYLASSGTCLLTAGGGAFQGSAKTMYSKLHTSGVSCVSGVPKC